MASLEILVPANLTTRSIQHSNLRTRATYQPILGLNYLNTPPILELKFLETSTVPWWFHRHRRHHWSQTFSIVVAEQAGFVRLTPVREQPTANSHSEHTLPMELTEESA